MQFGLEMVQIRLDVAGFHPIPARRSRAALEVLGNSRPDAFLERNLPDMCGLELPQAPAPASAAVYINA